ncbi:MAG: S8 family serine peptidase [Pyrinomonadaceae bacterium]
MSINVKKIFCFLLFLAFSANIVQAGISVVKSNGIALTQANGVEFVGTNGMRFTGADGFLGFKTNGMRFTGADGARFTGADGARFTGADGSTFTGTNGMRFTGADGVSLTSADGMRFTGADGYRFTGADGTVYQADSIIVNLPSGVSITEVNGAHFTGIDGLHFDGADISLTRADGGRFTGADGARFTGADSVVGINSGSVVFSFSTPAGFNITGPDGARFTGADVTITGSNGARFTGVDGYRFTGADDEENENGYGLRNVDPELAFMLNQTADDSNVNAVIVFHQYPTASDIADLQSIGIVGGTKFRILPMISVTTTRANLIAVSHLARVRSIYGNRTLNLNSDPYYKTTQIQRVSTDRDLQQKNAGMPVSGRNVTVAVLDTGVNSMHNDLAGKIVQNVRLFDTQSAAVGFLNPTPVENVTNTDLTNGHGTFVAGIVAGSGVNSGGKYNGVAPGAKILGLSAGDLSLIHILSGFDYLLEHRTNYNVRVVNCSFSADTVFDYNDPVNIATKMLTENGINVVFSAGNSGAGNGTLNPYAAAPWVISVGATDANGKLAGFSSRGVFGSQQFVPSLVAPGVDVVSLRSTTSQLGVLGVGAGADTQRLSPSELPFYTTASGTSFSAPQVAGAIALMLEANPNLSPAAVKDILRRSATPLPAFYNHEVGAGMLNTYAAVLEAAFPTRRTGFFRPVLDKDVISFVTSPQTFEGVVEPNSTASNEIQVPANTIETSVHIAWGDMLSPNDLGLKVFNAGGNLLGESNYVNSPGLNGRRETVTLDEPMAGIMRATVNNSFGMGNSQSYSGVVQTTRVEYNNLLDMGSLSLQNQAIVNKSLCRFLMLPEGNKFRPDFVVSRADLAAVLVRSGQIPQYVALNPMYLDVRDLTTRNAVESVQSNPTGKLILDNANNGNFYPHSAATKLVLAVAFVKASNLENLAATSTLPLTVADAGSIPAAWRGYVALALQKGWLSLDGSSFNPNRAITRIELARAIVALKQF